MPVVWSVVASASVVFEAVPSLELGPELVEPASEVVELGLVVEVAVTGALVVPTSVDSAVEGSVEIELSAASSAGAAQAAASIDRTVLTTSKPARVYGTRA